MNNPYYFIDENLKIGFKNNLKSHNISHANSLLNVTPNFPDIGIRTRYINKILKQMATFNARLINQYKFKHHIFFSASLYKINEEGQRSDEIEIFINLNINDNLTEMDNNDIDVKSQLDHQIQIQVKNETGWTFDKINSMKIRFYRTEDLNGLHLRENDHPIRVSIYKQYFKE